MPTPADGRHRPDRGRRSPSAVTAKPKIYSRAQWGADERMRDKASLHYCEVHAGFVHHTVNANDYTRAEVPGILRSIYAYHTQSRGWCDIGYNFLVDRFGRIWEGRYGGVDRPVVGAHTLGYNDYSFAMSAIGNFEHRPAVRRRCSRPTAALFAWKLSPARRRRRLDPAVGRQAVPSRRSTATATPARPPARASTSTPRSRRSARSRRTYQRSFAGRARPTNLVGIAKPDLVVRDRRTKQAFLVRSDSHRSPGQGDRDRHLPAQRRPGAQRRGLERRRPRRRGRPVRAHRPAVPLPRHRHRPVPGAGADEPERASASVRLLTAVGDITGDGRPDLLGQPRGGSMRIYPGNGATGFRAGYVAHARHRHQQLGVDLWNSDGSPDTMLRRGDGTLVLYPGNGPGGLTGGRRVGVARAPATTGCSPSATSPATAAPTWWSATTSTGRLWLRAGHRRRLAARPGLGTGDMRASTSPAERG